MSILPCFASLFPIIMNTKTVKEVTVVELTGEIDASTAPKIQAQVLPIIQSNDKILLDLSNVSYMSSAGLRLLLSLYRQVIAKNGKLVLVGLSEELQDTMSVTGFLDFFTYTETVDLGLVKLK
jgi:anti-sigma B factor antagonist